MRSHTEYEINIDIRIIFAIYSPLKKDANMNSFVATPTSLHHPQARIAPAQADGTFIRESSLPSKDHTVQPKPKLLDQVRTAIRLRHYSLRTEKAYVQWIK